MKASSVDIRFRKREIITLFKSESKTPVEIAKILDITEGEISLVLTAHFKEKELKREGKERSRYGKDYSSIFKSESLEAEWQLAVKKRQANPTIENINTEKRIGYILATHKPQQ